MERVKFFSMERSFAVIDPSNRSVDVGNFICINFARSWIFEVKGVLQATHGINTTGNNFITDAPTSNPLILVNTLRKKKVR